MSRAESPDCRRFAGVALTRATHPRRRRQVIITVGTQEIINGCILYPESPVICGIPHRLIGSPLGHLFWIDDFFLGLIRSRRDPEVRQRLSARFAVPEELVRHGADAVDRILFDRSPRKYFAPSVAPYRHPGDNPLISIVIVNWNGEKHLAELLGSIGAQSYQRHETIIVDNNSTDGSLRLAASFPGVRIFPQKENLGFCRGNNIGIRESRGEICFLLNNDTVLDNFCLQNAVACLAELPADTLGIFPKILFYHTPAIINCLKTQWHCVHLWRDNSVGLLDVPEAQKREQVFGGLFSGVFLSKDKFVRIGMFDERFFSYGEDFDICYRANLAGLKLFTEPTSIVYHKYRTSSQEDADISFTLYYFLRNYVLVILKNYEARNIPRAIRYFKKEFWSPWSSRARVNGEKEISRLLRKIIRNIILLAPHILRERARIKRLRRVSDNDLWVHDNVDRFNIFHYNGRAVLNLINLRAARYGNARYTAEGKEYVVFGKSRCIPGV